MRAIWSIICVAFLSGAIYAQVANACMICVPYPKTTFADVLNESESVILAKDLTNWKIRALVPQLAKIKNDEPMLDPSSSLISFRFEEFLMSLNDEFRKMVNRLTAKFAPPPIASIFLPPFYRGGQPKDAQFMAVSLEGGATGISFVLLPDEKLEEYTALQASAYVAQNPRELALEFGSNDPVKEMISLASINAICQHVMQVTNFAIDSATDSLGLLSISAGDRIGMVGLFSGLINTIIEAGAELVIIEKNDTLLQKFPNLPITLDVTKLSTCNKILCTSTTILNNSLDEILGHCRQDAFVSIIGPTAGYFPDPLFARGIDVVGGRVVKNGPYFLQLLAERKRWGEATRRICFQKDTYTSFISPIVG